VALVDARVAICTGFIPVNLITAVDEPSGWQRRPLQAIAQKAVVTKPVKCADQLQPQLILRVIISANAAQG